MSPVPIDQLHHYFQPIVAEVMDRALSRGLYAFITATSIRTLEFQACLYARGRVTPGKSATFGGLLVHTFRSKDRKSVVAQCGPERYTVPAEQWHKRVTWVLDSYHCCGFAADFSFRSAPGKRDDIIPGLEAAEKHAEIERLYRDLNAVWQEVCPECVWGGNWEHRDLPHWEWHPGKNLEQIRSGELPPYPKQCPECRNFRASMVSLGQEEICLDCFTRMGGDAAPSPAGAKCVGLN